MKSSMLAGEKMQEKNSELASFLQQTSEYTDIVKTQGDQFIQHDKNMLFIQKGQQLLQKFWDLSVCIQSITLTIIIINF